MNWRIWAGIPPVLPAGCELLARMVSTTLTISLSRILSILRFSASGFIDSDEAISAMSRSARRVTPLAKCKWAEAALPPGNTKLVKG